MKFRPMNIHAVKHEGPQEIIKCPVTGNQSTAIQGDYIVTTERGSIYPMKPDIFESMYIEDGQ